MSEDLMAVEGAGDAAGVDNFDPSSIIEKYASQLVMSKEAPAPEAPAPATPPAQTPALPGVGGQPSPATPPTPEPPPAEKPPEPTQSAKRLAALARKEAELAAREAALSASADQRVKDAVEAAKAELRDAFVRNPIKFVKDANVPAENYGKVATLLLGADLGDAADPSVKLALKQLEQDMELESIKQTLKAKPEAEKEPQADFHLQYQMAATDREIGAFVRNIPATEFPFLAAEAQADRAGTYQALCATYAPHVQADSDWPAVHEVARALEAQLRSEYERLAKVAQAQSASSTQPPPSAQQAAPTTLSDADLSRRPSREPEKLLTDGEYQQRAIARAQALGGLIRG